MKEVKGSLPGVEGQHTWSRERGYEPVRADEAEIALDAGLEKARLAEKSDESDEEKAVRLVLRSKAVEVVVARGYTRAAAEKIVDEHGPDVVLASS